MYLHTLLYIRPFFVAGVVFPVPDSVFPDPDSVFPAVGVVFPAGGVLPAGGVSSLLVLSSRLVVFSLLVLVSSRLVVSVRIYAADLPGGHRQRLLRAAAGLASETKLQGNFAGCDCSNYQLFMYSSRVGFYRAICWLKY